MSVELPTVSRELHSGRVALVDYRLAVIDKDLCVVKPSAY